MSARGGSEHWPAPLGPGVRVLHAHPCGLIALEKPDGVLSHPNKASEAPRSLFTAPYDEREQCFEWSDASGAAHRAHLLHRLDSATSGVILVATDSAVADAVRRSFEHRSVSKVYVAIVLGHFRERRALWRDSMAVKRDSGSVRAIGTGPAGIPAETAVRCLRLIPGPPALAAIELEPHTGRTHQLRHQCARRKLPILGDQNYGNFKLNREIARRIGTDRLFLHAQRVKLEFATASGARVTFAAESPLPAAFTALIGRAQRSS